MAVESIPTNSYNVSTFIGEVPFCIIIDASPALTALIEEAEQARGLSFAEKLEVIEKIVLRVLKNNLEGIASRDQKIRELCCSPPPRALSAVLESCYASSEHQAALFLLLGAAARLGTKHYLQSSGIRNSCYFNEVYDENGTIHSICIWEKSFTNRVFIDDTSGLKQANRYDPQQTCLAYTIEAEQQCTLYSNPFCHFDAATRLETSTHDDTELLKAQTTLERFEVWHQRQMEGAKNLQILEHFGENT